MSKQLIEQLFIELEQTRALLIQQSIQDGVIAKDTPTDIIDFALNGEDEILLNFNQPPEIGEFQTLKNQYLELMEE